MAEEFEALTEAAEGVEEGGAGPSAEALAELAAVQEAEASAAGRLEAELATARAELAAERAALAEAVARYRGAVLAAAPEVPGELVRGATLDEVDESLDAAQQTVARIRSSVAAELGRAEGFPVGSPAREDVHVDGLSASEKIAYGLGLPGRG